MSKYLKIGVRMLLGVLLFLIVGAVGVLLLTYIGELFGDAVMISIIVALILLSVVSYITFIIWLES